MQHLTSATKSADNNSTKRETLKVLQISLKWAKLSIQNV